MGTRTRVRVRSVEQFLKELPIRDLALIDTKKGFNNDILVLADRSGRKCVVKLMLHLPQVVSQIIDLAPCLNPTKIHKEVLITKALSKIGFPTPSCLFYDEKFPNLALFEWADGKPIDFNQHRNNDIQERIRLATILGELIGTLFELHESRFFNRLMQEIMRERRFESVRAKHTFRFEMSKQHLASLNILDAKILRRTSELFKKNIELVPASDFKLIHGDIYSGNILMSDTGKVNALIDWADSAEVEDPLTDVILTARWLAFDGELENYTDQNAQSVFRTFILSFNKVAGTEYDPHLCSALIPLYDILWHFKILITEYHKNKPSAVLFFKSNLNHLLDKS